MVRLADLYRIVGRRLTEKLLAAGWIAPEPRFDSRGVVFDSQKVHRTLSRLCREGYTLLLRSQFSSTGAEERRQNPRSLEEIVLDEEALARLSEQRDEPGVAEKKPLKK